MPYLSFAYGADLNKICFADIPDMHLKAGIIPETATAKVFYYVQQLKLKVHFIIIGGDSNMNLLQSVNKKCKRIILFFIKLNSEQTDWQKKCLGIKTYCN